MALVPNREPRQLRRRAGSTPTAASRASRRAGPRRRLVSFRRRAGRATPTRSRALADGEPVNSIGGVYDALIAARPGSVRGFVLRGRVLGHRHAGRLLDHVVRVSGAAGARPAHASDADPPRSGARVDAIDPVGRCRDRRRLRRSTSASSPTACGCRAERVLPPRRSSCPRRRGDRARVDAADEPTSSAEQRGPRDRIEQLSAAQSGSLARGVAQSCR